MPAPLLLPAAIAAGGAIAGSGINAASQGRQNKKSREFSREMYARQRTDNLEDWHRQNSYNSPEQQMQRLKDAGLNPHLVYGQSSGGASGTAGSVDSANPMGAQFRNTRPGDMVANGTLAFINSMYDLDIKKAQANNLKAQNDVITQDAALRLAQTDRSKFDLGLDSELRSVSADARREQLRSQRVQNDVTLKRDEREAALNTSNLKEAVTRIASMRLDQAKTEDQRKQIKAQINNLRADTTLKQLDAELSELGITSKSPWWLQMVGRMINDFFNVGDSGSGLLDLMFPSNSN